MRTYLIINERTARRRFREHELRKRPLTVLGRDLPAFGFRIAADDTRTFFVRVARRLGAVNAPLGTVGELTAAEARAKALAEIETARAERATVPLMADFADEVMRRIARRWKPSTREGNRQMIRNYILPFFGAVRVADIDRAAVRRWFDSMSGMPGNANRTLPMLSVMMTQTELWDLRPQGSNPCRDMRRYKTATTERFLSVDELRRARSRLPPYLCQPRGDERPRPLHRGPPARARRRQVHGTLRSSRRRARPGRGGAHRRHRRRCDDWRPEGGGSWRVRQRDKAQP